MNNYKIVLIGASGTGKSSLAYWFVQGKPYTFSPTIGAAFLTKEMKIQKPIDMLSQPIPMKLHIWDTAGQERFRAIAKIYYKNTHGCLCVFDVTNRESFDDLPYWLKDYNDHSYGSAGIIFLIANKIDRPEAEWKVSREEIEQFSRDIGYPCLFTSCINGIGVYQAFETLCKKMLEKTDGTRPEIEHTIKSNNNVITLVSDQSKKLFDFIKCWN